MRLPTCCPPCVPALVFGPVRFGPGAAAPAAAGVCSVWRGGLHGEAALAPKVFYRRPCPRGRRGHHGLHELTPWRSKVTGPRCFVDLQQHGATTVFYRRPCSRDRRCHHGLHELTPRRIKVTGPRCFVVLQQHGTTTVFMSLRPCAVRSRLQQVCFGLVVQAPFSSAPGVGRPRLVRVFGGGVSPPFSPSPPPLCLSGCGVPAGGDGVLHGKGMRTATS